MRSVQIISCPVWARLLCSRGVALCLLPMHSTMPRRTGATARDEWYQYILIMRPSKRCKWRIFRLDTSLQDFLQSDVLYNFCKKSLWIFFYNFFKLLFRTIFRKCSLWIVYFKFCLLWFHIMLFVNFANCSSQPSMVHWLSSPIFPCSVVCHPAMVRPVQISLLVASHPQTHTFSESVW